MKHPFYAVAAVAAILLTSLPGTVLSANQSSCPAGDAACSSFAKLADAEQYEKIVEQIDLKATYSPEARRIIGQAYLMLAGRETNTPEQEEQFCLKALEYGATSAYMGLYFIHAAKDETKALGFLRQYVATQPKDSVPYVILGESELEKNNAAAAAEYLHTAKKVARGKSANLDWLLFQASYLTGDFATASAMLDSSLSQGKTSDEVKALAASDKRFADMHKRHELKKYFTSEGTTASEPDGKQKN